MSFDIGLLGNLELYFLLNRSKDLYTEVISKVKYLGAPTIYRNNWSKDLSVKLTFVDYDRLFNLTLNQREEITIEFQDSKNIIHLILMREGMLIFIGLKPWEALSMFSVRFSKFLMDIANTFVSGYELDVNHFDSDLSISQMKRTIVNLPFFYRDENLRKVQVVIDDKIEDARDRLFLLEESLKPIFT